jgi:DNA-binding MarR family transcriptional regulator
MSAYAVIVRGMEKPKSKKKGRPAADVGPAPATFYRGEAYDIEESLGHLARLLIGSMNRRIDILMQDYDLTAMQWKPLLMIKLGRGDTAAALAREACSDNGAMTRKLDRLEAKGLLKRRRSELDRRIVHLELTKEGERVSDLIPYALSTALNEHLAGFSKQEFQQMQSLLRRMIANGERVAGEKRSDPGASS